MKPRALLDTLSSPHQLRRFSTAELQTLGEEIRERIIEVVSANGGHLAANLGVIELTIAMHHVFDFTRDRLLWDVGHQCYPHKMLTGRAAKFASIRQAGGLSGFPSPAESPYDLFYTGHAGTAISTAAGLALADHRNGSSAKTVAVVGDASIVNGLSLEALNNASSLRRQFLVILNDNTMAIDRTRGALAEALEHVRLTDAYSDLKQSTENLLRRLPLGMEITDAIRQIKDGLRTTLHGGKVFEALGWNYFGPVDGHDVEQLIRVLHRVGDMDRPTILHVHTQKGRGCAYAVEDPCRFHSPSAYRIENGQAVFHEPARPTWTNRFAESLIRCARRDKRIVAITAAMPDGTGLAKFREVFPDRTIDVGISESHAVALAAGLARGGLKPVVAVYSTFMQRAFDQVFHEVALQKLPVVFCMDRAGLVGSDGAVHHGFADIALLRTLPGMTLAAPADSAELDAALDLALADGQDSPMAIRYPRDETPEDLPGSCPPFQPGKLRTLREGADGTILAYGAMVESALQAADLLRDEQQLELAVLNARFAKPLDTEAISARIADGPMIVVEDHARTGGLGSAVLELAESRSLDTRGIKLLALPDRFVPHASRQHQLRLVGLDGESIAQAAKQLLALRSDQ